MMLPTSMRSTWSVPIGTAEVLPLFSAASGFPAVNNSAFIDAFQEAFFDVIVNLDTNDRLSQVITPEWPAYNDAQQVMLFNVSASRDADIKVVEPDNALLERCAYVFETLLWSFSHRYPQVLEFIGRG